MGTKVKDVLNALDKITGGRVLLKAEDYVNGKNPFVVTKSSNIPGKAITETPGLVCGNEDQEVKKIGVCMTLSESDIELAGSMGLDAIVAHHPIADAANSGGVSLRGYLELYGLAAFELHEAFHGLHPGIPYLHGHETFRVEVRYGNIPGNILFVGKAMEGISTLGDILNRLKTFMGRETEEAVLKKERKIRGCEDIKETSIEAAAKIILGEKDSPVKTIAHIFPHTGFSPEHLEQVCTEHEEIDTLIASISRVKEGNPLIEKARELGLNFLLGNSHAQEIFENGTPLAKAINKALPETEVYLLQERVTATPVREFGSQAIKDYSDFIVNKFLSS